MSASESFRQIPRTVRPMLVELAELQAVKWAEHPSGVELAAWWADLAAELEELHRDQCVAEVERQAVERADVIAWAEECSPFTILGVSCEPGDDEPGGTAQAEADEDLDGWF